MLAPAAIAGRAALAARRASPLSLLTHVRAASSVPGNVSGLDSRCAAVLGSQWGDEGKGKLSDVLAKNYDIVARFNGGTNAGHTVVANGQKFAFHILPCGLVYPHTVNLIGNGCVVDVEAVFEELAPLADAGIDTQGRLKISDRAQLLFGYHKVIDGAMEAARGGKGLGTTRKGIGPAYTSKAMRSLGLRVGQLKHFDKFKTQFRATVEAHQRLYDFDYDIDEELELIGNLRERLLADDMIVDGVHYINEAYNSGKRIITEGANAAMLDLDFGTFPYVTSSTTTAGGIATGLGLAPSKLDCVMGVAKAYTTRVGEGPFPTELTDDRGGGARPHGAEGSDIGLHMQTVGAEIGVTTGRKRRCGWLDCVVLKYSHQINGYSSLNLTKLDVLDDLETLKIGVAYKVNGQLLPPGMMPATLTDLAKVEVVYESLPGWQQSIAHCRKFEELPPNAQAYVNRIEEVVGVPVTWVGVGAGREDMATKGFDA